MNARFGKRAVCLAVIMACDGDYSHIELQQRRIVGRLFTNRCYHEQDALEADGRGSARRELTWRHPEAWLFAHPYPHPLQS
jgi:hypothetical protein